jgi:hypothetical protein
MHCKMDPSIFPGRYPHDIPPIYRANNPLRLGGPPEAGKLGARKKEIGAAANLERRAGGTKQTRPNQPLTWERKPRNR